MLKNRNQAHTASAGGHPGTTAELPGNKLDSRRKKELKKDLMALFRKYGYMQEDMDYEVRFKTTSGNIAWININSIEIIK